MSSELHALYELHRHQILFNCTDSSGNLIIPKDYLYAVDERMYPFFHENWCAGEDPYLDCYEISKEFVSEVILELDRLWLDKDEEVPTFYQLEEKYGRDKRHELIDIIRYCYLHGGFDKDFYESILKPTEHPTEASGICRDLLASDIYLV